MKVVPSQSLKLRADARIVDAHQRQQRAQVFGGSSTTGLPAAGGEY